MSLWQICNGEQFITYLEGEMYRMVESQEQVATMSYVDSLQEQAVLETLLESAKPSYPDAIISASMGSELHYLLKTPFRYPPLPWGSRFGRTHEPSLFYGGKTLQATLSESAYYRFVFLHSMEGEPPKASLRTEHTLFSAGYRSNRGIKLQERPFFDYKMQLSHMNNYDISQALGSEMRACGVQVFEYFSARSKNDEVCVALFTPEAFADAKPSAVEAWFCELTSDQVSFKPQRSNMTYSFGLAQFLVDDRLPMPA